MATTISLKWLKRILLLLFLVLTACGTPATPEKFHDPEIDFSTFRNIAITPFDNLTSDRQAADRVRDTLISSLMASGIVYVIPPGEVARGLTRAGVANPTTPSTEEVGRLASIVGADAVITGVVREYGQIRSGSTTANVISASLRMFETSTQKVVWTASSTKGGISVWDRLFGGGGQPMNEVTQAAVDDLINKLFY